MFFPDRMTVGMMKIFSKYRPYAADLGRLLAATVLVVAVIVLICEKGRPGLASAVISPKVLVICFVFGLALALLEEKRQSG